MLNGQSSSFSTRWGLLRLFSAQGTAWKRPFRLGCALLCLSLALRLCVPLVVRSALGEFLSDERAPLAGRLDRTYAAATCALLLALCEQLVRFFGRRSFLLSHLHAVRFLRKKKAGASTGVAAGEVGVVTAALLGEGACNLLTAVVLFAALFTTGLFCGAVAVCVLCGLWWVRRGWSVPQHETFAAHPRRAAFLRELVCSCAYVLAVAVCATAALGFLATGRLLPETGGALALWAVYAWSPLIHGGTFLRTLLSKPSQTGLLPGAAEGAEGPKPVSQGGDKAGHFPGHGVVLRAERVTVCSAEGSVLVADLSFEVPPRGAFALVAESVQALQAVRDLLCGKVQPSSGRLFVAPELRRSMALIDGVSPLPGTTLLEAICSLRPSAGITEVLRCAQRAGVDSFLPYVPSGLAGTVGPPDTILSPGQQARVKLAAALLSECPFVILYGIFQLCDDLSATILRKAVAVEKTRCAFLILECRELPDGFADRCWRVQSSVRGHAPGPKE